MDYFAQWKFTIYVSSVPFLDAASAQYGLTLTSYRQSLEWHHRGVLAKVWPKPSQTQNLPCGAECHDMLNIWAVCIKLNRNILQEICLWKHKIISPSCLSDTRLTTWVLQLFILTHLKVKLIFYIILYVCVSEGLGTIKWIWLAEIDIDHSLDFPI